MPRTGIDPSRLGPNAQRQILEKLMQKQEEAKKRERKLNEEKVSGFLVDGTPTTFASKRERDRYGELALELKAGRIDNLEYQKTYPLLPKQKREDGTTERAVSYIADFVYERDGELVVEDTKGYRNPSSAAYAKYVLKRKLMLYFYGITVHET